MKHLWERNDPPVGLREAVILPVLDVSYLFSVSVREFTLVAYLSISEQRTYLFGIPKD